MIGAAGLYTIAVNSSWQIARFCDVIYAADLVWWDAHHAEIDIPAQRWTCSGAAAQRYGLNRHSFAGPHNSGALAVRLAVERGAARVILVGADCSLAHGIHWHGPHERTKNPAESRMRWWHKQYAVTARLAKKRQCEVINASRFTTLTCFKIQDLEAALAKANDCDVAVGRQSTL